MKIRKKGKIIEVYPNTIRCDGMGTFEVVGSSLDNLFIPRTLYVLTRKPRIINKIVKENDVKNKSYYFELDDWVDYRVFWCSKENLERLGIKVDTIKRTEIDGYPWAVKEYELTYLSFNGKEVGVVKKEVAIHTKFKIKEIEIRDDVRSDVEYSFGTYIKVTLENKAFPAVRRFYIIGIIKKWDGDIDVYTTIVDNTTETRVLFELQEQVNKQKGVVEKVFRNYLKDYQKSTGIPTIHINSMKELCDYVKCLFWDIEGFNYENIVPKLPYYKDYYKYLVNLKEKGFSYYRSLLEEVYYSDDTIHYKYVGADEDFKTTIFYLESKFMGVDYEDKDNIICYWE